MGSTNDEITVAEMSVAERRTLQGLIDCSVSNCEIRKGYYERSKAGLLAPLAWLESLTGTNLTTINIARKFLNGLVENRKEIHSQ